MSRGFPFAAAAPTPTVRLDDAACQDRSIGFESLPDDRQAKLVEPAEHGQVRAGEGGVRHVEVFRMSVVGSFIFEISWPLTGMGSRRGLS